MNLFNVTYEYLGATPTIIIDSKEIKIKNLKLLDLKTQTTLIRLQAINLYLDNLIVNKILLIDMEK